MQIQGIRTIKRTGSLIDTMGLNQKYFTKWSDGARAKMVHDVTSRLRCDHAKAMEFHEQKETARLRQVLMQEILAAVEWLYTVIIDPKTNSGNFQLAIDKAQAAVMDRSVDGRGLCEAANSLNAAWSRVRLSRSILKRRDRPDLHHSSEGKTRHTGL